MARMLPLPRSAAARIAFGLAAALGISYQTAVEITEDWHEDEGLVLEVYRDSAGIPTVCMGHTGPEVRMGDVWTMDQCIETAIADIVAHGRPVLNALIDPTSGDVRMWIGFTGNTGVGAFLASLGRKLQNAGRRVEACHQVTRWVYITVAGQKLDCRNPKNNCRGLPDRRDKQVSRCLAGTEREADRLAREIGAWSTGTVLLDAWID
jgi:lysozyme